MDSERGNETDRAEVDWTDINMIGYSSTNEKSYILSVFKI